MFTNSSARISIENGVNNDYGKPATKTTFRAF